MTCGELFALVDRIDPTSEASGLSNAEMISMLNHLRGCDECRMKIYAVTNAFVVAHPEEAKVITQRAVADYRRLEEAYDHDSELHS